MLRLLVLLLLLANGGYYAWSHGYLLPWGVGPTQQAEPQRLQQQVHPEAVRVLHPTGRIVVMGAELPSDQELSRLGVQVIAREGSTAVLKRS